MTSPHSLPPGAEPAPWQATHPELDVAWRLTATADPLAQAPAPDPNRIAQIQARLLQAASERPPMRLVQKASRGSWLAAAACVVLLLAAGVYWYQQPVTFTAPDGSPVAVTLPDASTARLTAGSALRYTRAFGDEARHVVLDGEAFFEVTKAEVPFIVETATADVIVLGTSFNVRAVPEEATAVVSVATGVVRVQARTSEDDFVVLQASEMARVASPDAGLTLSQRSAAPAVTVQRTGGFYCFDWSYGAIFDEMERRYGVEIQASKAIRERRRTFTKQQAETIEHVLNDFSQSAGLNYRPIADGYEVYERGE